jgi:Trypsin-co-occurring domain 1
MRGRVLPVRVGEVELLVETVPVTGTEPTAGRADDATRRAVEAFEQAQGAIVAVATRTAGTVRELASRAVCPDRVEVEFGLSFTAQGNVLVAAASAEASLKVTISYDRQPAPGAAVEG